MLSESNCSLFYTNLRKRKVLLGTPVHSEKLDIQSKDRVGLAARIAELLSHGSAHICPHICPVLIMSKPLA